MELHTVGYILDNLKIDDIAYCYKGACEGMFVFIDQLDDNYLKNINRNGEVSECFCFRTTGEDQKQWLFLNELEEGELKTKIIASMVKSIVKSTKKG